MVVLMGAVSAISLSHPKDLLDWLLLSPVLFFLVSFVYRSLRKNAIDKLILDIRVKVQELKGEALSTVTNYNKEANLGVGVLKIFRWFVRGELRDNVDLCLADLQRDRKDMKKKRMAPWIIQTALFWHSLRTVLPIIWDGSKRFIKEVTPFYKTISRYFGKD